MQLQLVQELEVALTSTEPEVAGLKEASHGIMTSLLRMLENGLPGPVRTSTSATRGPHNLCSLVHVLNDADSGICVEVFTRYFLR